MIIYSNFINKDTTVLQIYNNNAVRTSGFGYYFVIKPNPTFTDLNPTITIKDLLEDSNNNKEVCAKCFTDDHVTTNCELLSDFKLSKAQIKELKDSRLPATIEFVINEKITDKKPNAEIIINNNAESVINEKKSNAEAIVTKKKPQVINKKKS